MSGKTINNTQFTDVGPLRIYIENGKGHVDITASPDPECTEATVDVIGTDADDVRVELRDDELSIVVPQQRGGFFAGDRRIDIAVTTPQLSEVTAKLGSADLSCHGRLGEASVRSGSGGVSFDQLAGPALLETGSGGIAIQHAAQPLRIKSGSGDVTLRHTAAEVSVSTGSGDVEISEACGAASVKTGSGDLSVGHAHADISLATGSGDLVVEQVSAGRVQLKAASGDLRVGVPAGIPVWTDVTTVSGTVHSTLEGAGQPEEGAPYIEIRAKTVSGDVHLRQL